MAVELGRIEPVDPRDVWPNEAHDFTPWLLANKSVLAEALGMDLDLEAAEHPVGKFSLDLIGTDLSSGGRVIVENQLTTSDHHHLGQILTYAGGTDPTSVVWISTGFQEEHRAALEWLNERTDERTRFFAIRLEVVRIGASPPAPLLAVVVQPNDWGKKVRAGTAGLSELQAAYQQFWTNFLEQVHARQPGWTSTTNGPAQNYLPLPAGKDGVGFTCYFSKKGLCSEIVFGSADRSLNEARFKAANDRRRELEQAYGGQLAFEPLEGRKSSRIADYRSGGVEKADQWGDYVEWFIASQERLRRMWELLKVDLP